MVKTQAGSKIQPISTKPNQANNHKHDSDEAPSEVNLWTLAELALGKRSKLGIEHMTYFTSLLHGTTSLL